MWADMLQQQSIYRPGPYWERKAVTSCRLMHRLGLEDFRSTVIGTSYADNAVLDPMQQYMGTRGEWPARIASSLPLFKRFFALHRNWIAAYYRQAREAEGQLLQLRLTNWLGKLQQGFPELPPTTEEGCTASVEIEGTEYATYYLKLLSYIRVLEEQNAVPLGEADSLIEVGGGLGANLHLLLTRYPNIRKVVLVDLPTTLYVSTQYLKKFFDGVRDYSETSDQETIRFERGKDEREILTLCPWQLPRLEAEIDVSWNSNSFVEMTDRHVEFYCEQFQRLLAPRNGDGVFVSYDNKAGGSASLAELQTRISKQFQLQDVPSEGWSWWWQDRIMVGTGKQ